MLKFERFRLLEREHVVVYWAAGDSNFCLGPLVV